MSVVATFIVDVFPKLGASAAAALNPVRCLLAAGGTAAALPIVDGVGAGWTFTLVTGVMFSSLALLMLQLRLGSRKRKGEQREGGSTKETLGESSNS
jgi:hypothetical protein